MTDIQALAAPFSLVTDEDWRQLVDRTLGGASLDSLRSATREGIAVEPLYGQHVDARPLFARPGDGTWAIVQRLDHPDPDDAVAQARRELERGATGLALVAAGAPSAEGFGVELSPEALRRLLDEVPLDGAHLRVEPHADGPSTAVQIAGIVKERGLRPAAADLPFGLDPIGVAARAGGFAEPWREVAAAHGDASAELAQRGFRGPLLEADGRPWSLAGADAVQELAAVMAGAADYLRLLDRAGIAPQAAFALIGTTLTVDADQLVSIAKLRAARLLWARMQEACGVTCAPLRLHAETARLMMMRADPHTNLLRTTIAAFAAGVGGADSLTVLPFTIALGLPDALARRLARNTQLLLMEESHVHRVADPVAGSGAMEALTQDLARRAWAGLQEIEREGGLVESLAAGGLQARIAAQGEALVAAHAGREAGLVGVTHYVDSASVPVKVSELPPRAPASDRRPAVALRPLAPLELESRVSRVPESAP